jgi:hypothetical protein
MVSDQTVRIEELPSWWQALFRPRENDRATGPLIGPGPIIPYPPPAQPLVPVKTETSDRKLAQLDAYMAQRDRRRARPLRHLVASKYAGKSGLELLDLPVKAISGIKTVHAAKLAQNNIATVDELAKASMKELEATGMPQEELTLARSYARDIVKHATMPQITEYPLPLEEMLKPKYAKTPIKDLPNLPLDAMKGIGKATAKKIELAGIATKIGNLQGVSLEALIAAGAGPREAFLMADYSAMMAEHLGPVLPIVGEKPALGTLRVLTFDGQLKVGQSIEAPDPAAFEQPEYPLDKPNVGRTPEEIEAEPYVGYLLAADEIVITEDITTRGSDLILVAKTIQVGETGAITINTKSADWTVAANEETDGLDADNGGDLVFLCQEYTVLPGCALLTSGGKGQDGGVGKSMTQPAFLEEGVHLDKPQRSGSIAGVFWGYWPTLGKGQCKFHVDPAEWGHGWRIISYKDYHDKVFGYAVNVTGEWTLFNSIEDAAPCYVTVVDIPDPCYPTPGRPGGYGGNPGKISLILPDPSGATGSAEVQVEAVTGADGAPGQGGMGGDCTPDEVRRGGYPVTTADYLEEYTIKKALSSLRGEPDEPFVGGSDRFRWLVGEKLDGSIILDKLEDSICGVTFGADLLVLYAPNPNAKRTGTMKESFVWGGSPWPLRVLVSAVSVGSPLTALTFHPVDNSVAAPKQDSMGLFLDYGPPGEPKSVLPTVTESLTSLSKNWHQAVYEILPEYPLKQYEQADRAYRRGDFDLAAELYNVVLSFAQEVPAFQQEQAAVVSDAGYRLDRISAGYDYFGFTADTIIPTSPTRDYFPLPVTTAYSDTVEFYAESIWDTYDSIETIEMGKDTIGQFEVEHKLTVDDIQDSMAMLDTEMAILESETDAMEKEINALHWSNQRLSGLLQRWAQTVDDKIKELEKEKEDEGPGWWDVVIAVWNVIKLVASIVAVCYGYYAAAAASVEAVETLGELGDNINDLRIACGELVSHLDDWEWETINEYLDAMGGVAKEIAAWYDQVAQAWKEAGDKLKEVKATFEETQTKLDQLTAVNMTEPEAIEFQNNVLLADEIGVSGAMDYLQIQEQIYLNNDMLDAKYSSLEALTERRVQLAYQALSLARELAAHTTEAAYLDELLDAYTWNIEQKQAALEHLTNLGQQSLDALMHRLARQTCQLKFLQLDKDPSSGYYAYFIDEPGHAETVLQERDQLIADMNDWIEENNNIGRLKVVVTDDPDYADNPGGITIVDAAALARFSTGQYLRPSRILEIEPLRETLLVARLAEGISTRRSDPNELARLLISQFLLEEGGTYHLIAPYALGFDVSPQVVGVILSRERAHHPLLDAFPGGPLDDTTVVLAYALARGGVTLTELISVLEQTSITIPAPLKSRLEIIKNDWMVLSNTIKGEQARSLRSVVEAVRQAVGNPAEMRAVLDEALISGGQFVWLGRFHLNHQDIQHEIANSYDPDPSVQEAVLARAYGGEPGHVVAAVALLYAGLDAAALGSLAGEYATDPNPLGNCITNILKPQWNALRASVLEKRHDIQVRITPGDYLAIPNSAEMFQETRYLAARAQIPSDIPLVLERLPQDLYLRKAADGTVVSLEFPFENADDVVSQAPIATPLGLNVEDVHFSDLFGRSILGKWALSFTYKGNRPALPPLDLIELEFLHTYVEHD